MCGRYALYGPRSRSRVEAEYFSGLDQYSFNWNVAPTDTMPICRLIDGRPQLVAAKWGLIPPGAIDPRIGGKKINAPCENILKWAEYREPYRAMRRCLVPVGPRVGSVRNNDASLVEPIEEADRCHLEHRH